MLLSEELITELREWDPELRLGVTVDTPLITSGLLDSLGLFHLVEWVEERTGSPIDPTTMNLAAEWNTVGDIVRFVEGWCAGRAVAPEPPEEIVHTLAASATYQIVRYSPAFRDQVVQLQSLLWGRGAGLNSQYLRWKYEENPYASEPHIYLALFEGVVVGMRGMMGARWEAGHPVVERLMFYADDLVIVPEHRNRGLFALIMRTALDDLARRGHTFVVNLSAGPVTLLESITTGWRSTGHLSPLGWRKHRWSAPLSQRSANVSIDRSVRPDQMADLIARQPWDGRIRHVRDSTYFAWRFSNPVRDYRFLYWQGERLEGYLVTHTDSGRVHIVDWEASSEGVAQDLLTVATSLSDSHEVVIWGETVDETARACLRTAGFQPTDVSSTTRGFPCVLARAVRDQDLEAKWTLGSRELLRLADWDVRMIYSMAG